MQKNKSGGIGETIKTVVYAVVIAFGVRTFAYEPFNIPSGSMIPTLLVGDYLFVSKFSYGYSRYSVALGAAVRRPHLDGKPERGDVAVFKLPRDNKTDYIKRVIGLPGDRIQVINGILNINGEPVKRDRIEDFVTTDQFGRQVRVAQYMETLPNGRKHRIIEESDNGLAGQHPGLCRAGEPLLLHGRQPRQLARQPRQFDGRLRAGGKSGRPGGVPVLLDREGSRFWEFWKWPWAVRFSRIFDGVS